MFTFYILNIFVLPFFFFFFFNDTATTEIYTLSLHDALPIWLRASRPCCSVDPRRAAAPWIQDSVFSGVGPCSLRLRQPRSEEHTSELQSHLNLVCRLLLEKKNSMTILMLEYLIEVM